MYNVTYWVLGGVITGLLLVLEHLIFYRKELLYCVRYGLGVGALGAGFSVWLLMQYGESYLPIVIGFWGITIVAGLVVGIAYLVRGDERPGEMKSAFEDGQLVARAREDRVVIPRER